MNVTGAKVTLRAVEAGDLAQLQVWANDPDIQYMLGGWHFPTNMNDQQKWFQSLSCNSMNQRFIVEDLSKEVIGMANLVSINFKDGNAELGLLLDKKHQNKGFGKEIVYSLMNYAFNELRLNRLETTIIATNKPSLSLFLNKCGWKQEGILKSWYFRQGHYIDKHLLGILKEEFLKTGA